MMHEEFEKLAGYKVSYEDYVNIIEPMYMSLPTVSKADFVKMIDKKRFALKPIKAIVKEMQKTAESLKQTCNHYTDYEAKDKLDDLAREYLQRKGWSGLVGFMVNDKMTSQKCYYPASISFYSYKTYKNIEVLQLTA